MLLSFPKKSVNKAANKTAAGAVQLLADFPIKLNLKSFVPQRVKFYLMIYVFN
jgi:hypothetical protein